MLDFKLMIVLHRLNGKEFVVNCELIMSVEATPDTLITFSNNEKVMVRETVPEVMAAALKFKQQIFKFPG